MPRRARSREHPRWRRWRLARRVSQGVFLVLFLWLIALTVSVTGSGYDATSSTRIAYPVELFLNLDPFAGALMLLTTGTIPGAMILGLIVLASGFLFGRGFCGWICPMGTMNHLASEVASGLKGKRRFEANRYRPYQKIKYLLLIVFWWQRSLDRPSAG